MPEVEKITEEAKTSKIDGVSSQINLMPGSEAHRMFARLKTTAGADMTAREFMMVLMRAYENPPAPTAEAQAELEALRQRVEDLESENRAYQATQENEEMEIEQLKQQLEAATNEANANAERGLGTSLQLDELRQRTEGAIILKPNPVTAHFLNEMAEQSGRTPAEILEKLFIEDLQNPWVDHLPYTVSSKEIRRVMEEIKKQEAHDDC